MALDVGDKSFLSLIKQPTSRPQPVPTSTPSFVMQWPTVASALTPDQEMALSEYRRGAASAMQRATASAASEEGRAKARNIFEREDLREQIRAGLRENMMELGGRGLARQPVGGGRARIQFARAEQRGAGELGASLADRLAEIRRALGGEQSTYDAAMSQARLQEAILRSDPQRLMGVA